MQLVLQMFNRVTIIGAGSWGTALVKIFTDSGIKVSWLVRKKEDADFIRINGYNPKYLCTAQLNKRSIDTFTDFNQAIEGTELILFAVPSAYLQATVSGIDKKSIRTIPLAVSIKGLIPGTGNTPAMFLADLFDKPQNEVLVFGGPCHAEEIVHNKNTYLTISSANTTLVNELCKKLSCDYITTIPSEDPTGIEYAAILKNIIGVASGVAQGLLYGDNFKAVLVSNAMREAGDLIAKIIPGKRDLFQSAYFGDLLVTAYSNHSRNRTLGKMVARGIKVNNAIQSMEMIAEGYHASKELAPIMRRTGVKAPILNAVHRILHRQASPFSEFQLLEAQLS